MTKMNQAGAGLGVGWRRWWWVVTGLRWVDGAGLALGLGDTQVTSVSTERALGTSMAMG